MSHTRLGARGLSVEKFAGTVWLSSPVVSCSTRDRLRRAGSDWVGCGVADSAVVFWEVVEGLKGFSGVSRAQISVSSVLGPLRAPGIRGGGSDCIVWQEEVRFGETYCLTVGGKSRVSQVHRKVMIARKIRTMCFLTILNWFMAWIVLLSMEDTVRNASPSETCPFTSPSISRWDERTVSCREKICRQYKLRIKFFLVPSCQG